jgi:hypothetical protein
MAKFYVKSGELERIVTASDPKQACEKAIETCSGETIDGYFFYVDERGFRSCDKEDGVNTEFIPEHSIPVDEVIETVGFEYEDEEE